MTNRKTIVFDFDGVIHKYSRGWQDGSIYDEPVEGIKDLIDELRKTYDVVIVSTRCRDLKGQLAMREWLDKYHIEVDDYTSIKVPAILYIDDRAICFNGKAEDLKKEINVFRTWQEKQNKLF